MEDEREADREGDCVFCEIVRTGRTHDGSEILHEDEKCIAIQDLHPAALHHFLVIPKEHIATTNSLDQRHRNLVVHMYDVGKKLMKETRPEAHCKFGFHQPPFYSVKHLHMHCLCPPYTSMLHAMKYKSLPWFITAEAIVKRLSLR